MSFKVLVKALFILAMLCVVNARHCHRGHRHSHQNSHSGGNQKLDLSALYCVSQLAEPYGENWIRDGGNNNESLPVAIDGRVKKLNHFYYKLVDKSDSEPARYVERICSDTSTCDESSSRTQINVNVPFKINGHVERLKVGVDCLCIDNAKQGYDVTMPIP